MMQAIVILASKLISQCTKNLYVENLLPRKRNTRKAEGLANMEYCSNLGPVLLPGTVGHCSPRT